MSTVVILGSGVMGSALAVPLADNRHEVRLVGTHLDREIIDAIRSTGVHPGLERELPAAVRPYQTEELEAAFADAEIVVSGVNSFGVRWAGERLAPLLQPDQLVLAIAKGVSADEDGNLRILPGGARRARPLRPARARAVRALASPLPRRAWTTRRSRAPRRSTSSAPHWSSSPSATWSPRTISRSCATCTRSSGSSAR